MNIKFTSKVVNTVLDITEKRELSDTKKRYIKPKIRNKAPNCVQKNIRYAASTHLLVLANL
jgi:hypothetical protein